MNAEPLTFGECIPGVRVIVTTGRHRGKRAVIHHPINKMVAITLNGEQSTRNFRPSSLVYDNRPEQPAAQEQPRVPPRRGFFGRPASPHADSADPDTEPTVPTNAGRRNHTRLQRAVLTQTYVSDRDFSRVVDDLTQTLVDMNFGSSAPVLEFLRDRLEATEAAALGNNTAEGE